MQNIFSLISAAFFAPAFRYVTLFLLSAAALPVCGMQKEEFKQFTLQGKKYSFTGETLVASHQKACALLYVSRDKAEERDRFLEIIKKYHIGSIDLGVTPSNLFLSIFIKELETNRILSFLVFTEKEFEQYGYYSNSDNAAALEKALSGEAHYGPKGVKVSEEHYGPDGVRVSAALHASSFTTKNNFVPRILQRFFSGVWNFNC